MDARFKRRISNLVVPVVAALAFGSCSPDGDVVFDTNPTTTDSVLDDALLDEADDSLPTTVVTAPTTTVTTAEVTRTTITPVTVPLSDQELARLPGRIVVSGSPLAVRCSYLLQKGTRW